MINSDMASVPDKMTFFISEADESALSAYLGLLEEAAAWLWARGVHQWQPGEHSAARSELLAKLRRGVLIMALADDRPAGGCLLAHDAPACWPDAPDDALHLSGLVVARWASGRDLGGRILDEAMRAVRRRGKARLRLDCWDGNGFLKQYYRAQGFQDNGRVKESDYWVRLFEKRI